MRRILDVSSLLLALFVLTGCEDSFFDDSSSGEGGENVSELAATGGEAVQAGGAVVATAESVPADLSGVVWLHEDVSGWAQTASMSASVSGASIRLSYSHSKSWPAKEAGGADVNANPWVFVYIDGIWYAGTFEWFRPGQDSKPVSTVSGGHIKTPPLSSFRPQSGEVYGFMVSGLARDETRNVYERSNVDMLRWP